MIVLIKALKQCFFVRFRAIGGHTSGNGCGKRNTTLPYYCRLPYYKRYYNVSAAICQWSIKYISEKGSKFVGVTNKINTLLLIFALYYDILT